MKEYKGYMIPDTYEEIKEYTNKHFIKDALLQPGIPSLSFMIEDSKISVPITIEEFVNAEDNEFKRNLLVSTYVHCIIAFIAHKESDNNSSTKYNLPKVRSNYMKIKIKDLTIEKIREYCAKRLETDDCPGCELQDICDDGIHIHQPFSDITDEIANKEVNI